jgi:hypothetical protein
MTQHRHRFIVPVFVLLFAGAPASALAQASSPRTLQVVLQQSLTTAECATTVAILEKGAATEVVCRNTEIRFGVRPGQSLSTGDIARAAAAGGRANNVVLRAMSVFGQVDLILSSQHNPADDAALLDALRERRGVTAATAVSPRRLRLQILPGNPVQVGALVQTYVRALGRKGPTLLTDFLSEIVFHGASASD